MVAHAESFPPSAISQTGGAASGRQRPDSCEPSAGPAATAAATATPAAALVPVDSSSASSMTRKPKKARRTQLRTAADASLGDAQAESHASPAAGVARKKGTSVVNMTAVQYSVAQAEQIELKAQPQASDEDTGAPSLTVAVWVPLRAPAALLARHRGLLLGEPQEAVKLTQLPLVLQVGVHIDCLYQGQWWDAVIKRVSGDACDWGSSKRQLPADTAGSSWGVLVHYVGWSSKHDQWVVGDLDMATKFAPLGTYTDPLKLMS